MDLQKENPGGQAGALDEYLLRKAQREDNRRHRARQGTLVKIRDGDDAREVRLKGRVLWALQQLIMAGDQGVTPIERPAPRWSDYIHKLRAEGFAIETIREPHGGAFPGSHGRYVLRGNPQIGGME